MPCEKIMNHVDNKLGLEASIWLVLHWWSTLTCLGLHMSVPFYVDESHVSTIPCGWITCLYYSMWVNHMSVLFHVDESHVCTIPCGWITCLYYSMWVNYMCTILCGWMMTITWKLMGFVLFYLTMGFIWPWQSETINETGLLEHEDLTWTCLWYPRINCWVPKIGFLGFQGIIAWFPSYSSQSSQSIPAWEPR
jgi:hypothetical protein